MLYNFYENVKTTIVNRRRTINDDGVYSINCGLDSILKEEEEEYWQKSVYLSFKKNLLVEYGELEISVVSIFTKLCFNLEIFFHICFF